jgi:hypothetical protein
MDEVHPSFGQARQRRTVAGVGEFVQHCDVMVGVIDHVMHEVGSDQTGTSGDEKPSH